MNSGQKPELQFVKHQFSIPSKVLSGYKAVHFDTGPDFRGLKLDIKGLEVIFGLLVVNGLGGKVGLVPFL